MTAVEIKPSHPKFAEDLKHGDYLGALMNLGIKREDLGEVVVKDDRAFGIARGKSKAMFAKKLVQINHVPCLNPSVVPKEGDILSVRAHGRIVYRGIVGDTKKGNDRVNIGRYV